MSDHREKAKRLLLTYLNQAATSSDMPFTGDNVVEIEQIVDEIIEAVEDKKWEGLNKLETEFGHLKSKMINTADAIQLLDKDDAQHSKSIEAMIAELTETAAHIVILEERHDAVKGKVDQLEERRRENDRDRIAINGLRLSVENLTKALGDKP